MNNKKLLLISSTGGHLSELMQLKDVFSKYDYYIVTEKTKSNENMKDIYKEKMSFLIYGTKKNPFTYLFIFLFNIIKSFVIFLKQKPDIVITTGTHTAVPMSFIAKLFKKKVIFIETFANRTTKTIAGKIVYKFADVFVVQWEEMLKIYPKAECWGWIY